MLQRSSRIVLGILWGCIIGVAVVIGVVRFYGDSEGYDPTSWAWIDTVSCFGLSSEIDGLRQGNCTVDLRYELREAYRNSGEVYTTGQDELHSQVHCWLEHCPDSSRLRWWRNVNFAVGH